MTLKRTYFEVERSVWLGFVRFGAWQVWKTLRNREKWIRKSIDMSILKLYYRGSFWIQLLFRSIKTKRIQNITPHSTSKDRFSSQLPVFHFVCKINDTKKSPRTWAIFGGAAGYCLRVRKIFMYPIYERSLFFYLGDLNKERKNKTYWRHDEGFRIGCCRAAYLIIIIWYLKSLWCITAKAG